MGIGCPEIQDLSQTWAGPISAPGGPRARANMEGPQRYHRDLLFLILVFSNKPFFWGFRSRLVPPACITPKGNCPTSSVDPPKVIQPTTERATREPGAVQPGPPRCTWNAATNTASQHLCDGPGALLPRHGHPSSLLAADPGPNCPGILIRAERPNTSRFGTFSTPTCCPESSPS